MTACTVLQCSSMSFSKELPDDMTLSPDFFLSFLYQGAKFVRRGICPLVGISGRPGLVGTRGRLTHWCYLGFCLDQVSETNIFFSEYCFSESIICFSRECTKSQKCTNQPQFPLFLQLFYYFNTFLISGILPSSIQWATCFQPSLDYQICVSLYNVYGPYCRELYCK